jgi:plasmid segregation protein ParM
LYKVVLAGSAGFRKAKRWGGSEREAVALVPGSPLAYHYPVVEYGVPLPRLSRADLAIAEDEPSHYLFPTEQLARAAACLDEALAWQSGCMVRKENQRWLLTDGLHRFRVYHYEKDSSGQILDLTARFDKFRILPYTDGPAYWSYLSEAVGADDSATSEVGRITVPRPVAAARTPTMTERQPTLTMQKGKKMILSVDIGYGYTKGVGSGDLRFSFPSVIGNAEEITFNTNLIGDQATPVVHYGGRRFFYGEHALLQSRLRTAIFDRSRTHDETYRLLFASALAELAQQYPDGATLNVVTGLPVGFFSDRHDAVISLEGKYRLQLEDAVTFDVEQVFVVPQPFGSLFRELLNEDGALSNVDIEQGRVAVVDVGTYTTDFIVADALRYVQRFSNSIPIGWSAVLNNVQQELSSRYRLDLTLHEVDKAIRSGRARVKGELINLEPMLRPAISELEAVLVAKARDLWGEGATLDIMLITGGAAQHVGGVLQQAYPQTRLLSDAFWANAEGFYRFGQRPATFGEH